MSEQSKQTAEFAIDELVDMRHPPIYERRAVKSGEKIAFGQAIKLHTDGSVMKSTAGEAHYGVAMENADKGYVSIVVHGTIKRDKVTVNDAAIADADIIKLKAAGIYVLN